MSDDLDFEKMLRASEQQLTNLRELEARTAGILGHAESPDGRVAVDWSPEGELARLAIDPRALRDGSGNLAETITEVAREAKRDLQRQLDGLTDELFGPAGDPVTAQPDPQDLKEAIAEIQQLFNGGLNDASRLLDRMRRTFER